VTVTRWPSSLRLRLTLWYALLLGLPLIAFAIVCYVVFSRALLDRTDRFIDDSLGAFSRELVAERRAASSIDEAMRTTINEVRFPDLRIAIADSGGRIVVSTAAREEAQADQPPPPAIEHQFTEAVRASSLTAVRTITLGANAGAFRVVLRPVVIRGERFRLGAAYPLRDIEQVLDRARRLFAVAIPLFVLLAGIGGYFLAKRGLAPVAAMSIRAAAITVANLDERLPVGGGAELVGLAEVVNDLLDRLQDSFEQQRRFMADASHELRTPTAIVRTEAEVTLSRPRTEQEYRSALEVTAASARRLTRIVDDLFLLARADAGHLVARHEPLYIEELLHDAVRGMRPVAGERGVTVRLGEVIDGPFTGDADLLGRLLLNLVDNAVKHSPRGSEVVLDMGRRDGFYLITVTDSGPGIPPDMHHRIFERFFRVDVGRDRSSSTVTSGAGLGLAIGSRIAELHGGSLRLVESRPGRTQFEVSLPAVSG
jgi:two-component system OmpR family sensor kinase